MDINLEDLIDFFRDEAEVTCNEDVVRYLESIKESNEEIANELRTYKNKSQSA